MLSSVAAVVGVYLLFVGVLFVIQRSMMYHPGSGLGLPAHHGVPEMVSIKLKTADGLKHTCWYKSASTNQPTIAYFQGNAGHIGDREDKVRPYLDAGYGVLLVGYRGFGDNPGSPSEEGLYMDAEAALDFLKRTGVQPDHWILYGESLGSGPAVEMAARYGAKEPVGAVVLEAPFTSMGEAAQTHYPIVPAKLLVRDRYDSIEKIAKISAPLMIVHGERDGTVPIKLGKRLFEAAVEPKRANWILEGDHNNLYSYGAAQSVIEFISDMWRPKR